MWSPCRRKKGLYMKKLIVWFFLCLACVGYLSAQAVSKDTDITVTSNVSKHIYILSLQDLSFGPLSTTSLNTATGTILIRSNHSSWQFRVYAEKGALAEWDTLTSSYVSGGDLIPYTFTFNSTAANSAERIIAKPVPTALGTQLVATFGEKTKYGANGEPFSYSVEVTGTASGSDWGAGDYRDVLYVSLSVN